MYIKNKDENVFHVALSCDTVKLYAVKSRGQVGNVLNSHALIHTFVF